MKKFRRHLPKEVLICLNKRGKGRLRGKFAFKAPFGKSYLDV